MALFEFLWRRPGRVPSVITPLTSADVLASAEKFKFVHAWRCGCGAQLRIRTAEPRAVDSNWNGDRPDRHGQRHSVVAAGLLSWDGLANERGWETNPTRCPACVAGLPLATFKAVRREARVHSERRKADEDAARAAQRAADR
jgi:hypothetical protein